MLCFRLSMRNWFLFLASQVVSSFKKKNVNILVKGIKIFLKKNKKFKTNLSEDKK